MKILFVYTFWLIADLMCATGNEGRFVIAIKFFVNLDYDLYVSEAYKYSAI